MSDTQDLDIYFIGGGVLKTGYQLVVADLNGDGRKDLIALDERATELAWFENPGWQGHVLATDVPRPINADCWDVDGDGPSGVTDPALLATFKADKKDADASKRRTQIEEEWAAKAKANYAKAVELANAVK